MNPAQIAIIVLVLICLVYTIWIGTLHHKLKKKRQELERQFQLAVEESKRNYKRVIRLKSHLEVATLENETLSERLAAVVKYAEDKSAVLELMQKKSDDDTGYIKYLKEKLKLAREMKGMQPLRTTLSIGQPTTEELERFKS